MGPRLTDRQIERFLNGDCTEEEFHEIIEIIRLAPDYNYLLKEWDATGYSDYVDRAVSRRMLVNIKERTGLKANRFKWASVAAAVVIFLITTATLLIIRGKSSIQESLALERIEESPVADAWKYLSNDSDSVLLFVLPDSSVIKLYSGAHIRYRNDVDFSRERNIYLKGKAFFDVYKSEKSPFTVFTGMISTTALGTSFTITEQQQQVLVELYTGKVILRKEVEGLKGWKEDRVLKPGQRMQYKMADGYCKIDNMQKEKMEKIVRPESRSTNLVFNNSSLPDVMDSLSLKYRVKIQYDSKSIMDRYFSGTIHASDSLEKILQLITQLNDLKWRYDKEQGYTITTK